ncbi:hypothetical protein [Alloscardovia criceti]|uniref:hypothetical protein n=1 Tax=Alloscardovia criceti TaxID=356828 RepID=UPI000374903F|nr:hypothetical protein [Alloscardovia criceti]
MYGRDSKSPQNFLEQISQASPLTDHETRKGETVSAPVLSRKELKAQQAQALRSLIHEDLGHTTTSTTDTHTHEDTDHAHSWWAKMRQLNPFAPHPAATPDDEAQAIEPLAGEVIVPPALIPETVPPHASEIMVSASLASVLSDDTTTANVSSGEPVQAETTTVEDTVINPPAHSDSVTAPVPAESMNAEDEAPGVVFAEWLSDDLDDSTHRGDESLSTAPPSSVVSADTPRHPSTVSVRFHDWFNTVTALWAARKRVLLIGAASVTAVIVLVSGGVWVYESHTRSACTEAVDTYDAARIMWRKSVTAATAALDTISVDQVADPATRSSVETLVALHSPHQASLSCTVNGQSLTAVKDQALSDAAALSTDAHRLDAAVGALTTSQADKTLADAKTNAQAKLDEANNLYNSTDGQVADNATRDQLKTLIDTLQAALNDTNATVESINKAVEPLQGAMDGVNNSVQVKKEADEKAKAEAEAQAQADTSSPSSSQSSPSYSTPRQSTPSSPPTPRVPSTPSTPSPPSWDVPQDPGEAYLPGQL